MKALIITDVQHDFMPGGTLGIEGANAIIPLINAMLPKFEHIFAVQDWHPQKHVSFASAHGKKPGERIQIGNVEQILWPDHCVQNTRGADFAKGLHKDRVEAIFHKGSELKIDSYSAFFDSARRRSTGLADHLRKSKIDDLYFVGVATDYCILYSVLDALELGFKATVIRDACRAINLKPDDEEQALRKMSDNGANIIFSSELPLRF